MLLDLRKKISEHTENEDVKETIDLLLESKKFRDDQFKTMQHIKLHDKVIFVSTLTFLILIFFMLGHSPTYYFLILYLIFIAFFFIYR
jgi:hypothetical protein